LNIKIKSILSLSIALSAFISLPQATAAKAVTQTSKEIIKVPYEKFVLDNGLQVIFHIDKSDPIVSTAILYHVGSNREEKGKTGFAHLFEHMLFQRSENVPEDTFFQKVQNAGGTLNGFTTEDGTTYFEVAPSDALETLLWLESDRMGYFINTITEQSFNNQQEVVQNEKRQRNDNMPYGQTSYIVNKNLFPENHPYNWQVIGALEDLQKASVEDVKNFYRKYYVPNNATLVIAGDIDVAKTKALVKKYFGEIKKGNFVKAPQPWNVTLKETKKVFHEDNFAQLPELTLAWPTAELYSKDSYALEYLAELLSTGKKAPLYKALVVDKKLTSEVSAYNEPMEITGKFEVSVRTFPDISLGNVEKTVFEAFRNFEKTGFTDKDLEGVKAKLETGFYNGFARILNKSIDLANYNTYASGPSFLQQDLANLTSVTRQDIMRVYNKYIKNKNYVSASFVPKGKTNLMVDGAKLYPVVEEKIVTAQDKPQDKIVEQPIKKTPSKFDRSKQPQMGKPPLLHLPEIWKTTLKNGIKIQAIENKELPLVNFSMLIQGGQMLESPEKAGVSNLLAQMLTEGTKNKTPEQLEEALNLLGSTISVSAGKESIRISGNTLSRNYEKTMALVQEMLLSPRWDKKEFDLLKQKTLNSIRESNANPAVIADNIFNKLLYGQGNIIANPVSGLLKTVDEITTDDLKKYYINNFSPSVTSFQLVGDINKNQIISSLSGLEKSWKAKPVNFPLFNLPPAPDSSKIYFVDIPKAKQSVINIGNLVLSYKDKDYFPAYVMNYKLGGSFTSNLNLILREEKGYTYGARSGFSGSRIKGPFRAASSVKSNTTYDSVKIFKEEIEKYRNGISSEDLNFTKSSLIRSNARSFESYGELLGMLENISIYNLPANYIKEREKIVNEMTTAQVKALAEKYIQPGNMYYVVAGDAETQLEPLKNLGLGDPVKLDIDGNIINN
jgi:zinc protease